MKKKQLLRGLASVFIVLFSIMLIATLLLQEYSGIVNQTLGIQTSKLVQAEEDEPVDTAYYKSEFGEINETNKKKLEEAEDKFTETEAQEGCVLLMNEEVNGAPALPLATTERNVTLLGHGSFEPVYKPNSGGGSVNRPVSFYQAFKNKNFNVNETMYAAYQTEDAKRGTSSNNLLNGDYNRAEEPLEFYTQEIRDSFNSYNDVAVVVLSRMGGEDRDLPQAYTGSGDYNALEKVGQSYLALYQDEKDLITLAKDNFKKVVVLLNSGYAMECHEFAELGVDAVLWTAGCGNAGFNGVVDLLTGASNPSGKLVDTYATNSLSAPAIANSGAFTFTNAAQIVQGTKDDEANETHYLVYQEGIYVGYKYYETRYEDVILNQGNASDAVGAGGKASWKYDEQVTYPFGYGLSYTEFEQKLVGHKETATGWEITVEVTNKGDVPGKSVVEVYGQAPYISGGVEKSAIQLLNFGKTKLLAKDEKDTLTIPIDKYLIASYDSENAKGYILDKGDYYFAIGNDCHDALNNVLAAKGATGMYDQNGKSVAGDADKTFKWTNGALDTDTYSKSPYGTGIIVTNRFDDMDINYWIPNKVKYLTRSDWKGTFPTTGVELSATEAMIKAIGQYNYVKPENAKSMTDYKMGIDNGINFIDMKDVAYDDPIWESFLDQFTLDDFKKIIMELPGNEAIESIAKPANKNTDGPDGIGGGAYSNEVVLASSWNKETVRRRGELMGEDGLFLGVQQVWGGGANTHRTPFSGRNFEYYSEDPTMAYMCGAEEAAGMQSKGLMCAIKHFAGNDQETYRNGLNCFMTEQTWREVYLRAFEGAFAVGKAMGTMTSFTRVGMTYFGASSATQNDVLRNEWGFKGVTITDCATATKYMQTVDSLVGGTDMFNAANVSKRWDTLLTAVKTNNDGNLVQCMRDAAKHFCYAYLRTNLINGLSTNTRVIQLTPWWESVSITFDVLFGVAAVSLTGLAVYFTYFKKEEK